MEARSGFIRNNPKLIVELIDGGYLSNNSNHGYVSHILVDSDNAVDFYIPIDHK